jgi:transcriptional regulator with XRE-family HTH domain
MATRKYKPREIRLRLGLNQTEFWERLGITQSGGSRYEHGRKMPKTVQELLRLAYVEQVNIRDLRRADMEVISYVKKFKPKLFQRLRAAASRKAAGG